MEDWKAKIAWVKDWRNWRDKLGGMKDWKNKLRWMKDREAWREKLGPVGRWLMEHRERLAPPAAFLALSLVLFLALAIASPGPAQRVAGRYMDAAFSYDYMELYSLFDQPVLDLEMKRYGLDASGMKAVAQVNSAQVEQYVAQVERTYGVDISYDYKTTEERALEPPALDELRQRYEHDGFRLEILEARQVTAWVNVHLVSDQRAEMALRDVNITAICTPSGWWLDRDSIHAFLHVIYDLPTLAQERFGE